MLCTDALCEVNLETNDVFATENPTTKNSSSFPILTLNVDMRNNYLFKEFYIGGSTLDNNVKSSLKGIITVCGKLWAF